ncbi:MAG: serine--tRNA ligase [Christensenellales bacterium]|jgi:seryl-tRNA synthetase
MLDPRRIRENPEILETALKSRRSDMQVAPFLELDARRRALLGQVESLRARRTADSKKIPLLKKEGGDVSQLLTDMKSLAEEIGAKEETLKELDEKFEEFLLSVPNIPSKTVPDGADDSANEVIRAWGKPPSFDFEPLPHWDIGENLGILDFEAAARVTGARFTFYKGAAAQLERAVYCFFLDTHIAHGYTEVFPPYMVHRRSMVGTGQLPKFEEDAFKVAGTNYFLIPTAEVPVTNMYREQILNFDDLPIYHTAYSACFRAEAGSAGRDTRGLIRQHQFNKVELVKFTRPETSYDELELLTSDAERVLQLLGLPYRVSLLCTGDMGFASAKTYDLEVWMPSYGRYVEISSCSNFEDFQARRAGIRFRDEDGRVQFVHTLNGSGVAVGRTVAAILENYQKQDGSVEIPPILRPYMGGRERIEK